jgi:hypothetical protein
VYPSIFVLLVGPPGAGKSVMLRPVRHLWARAESVNIAPDSMTKAGMIDRLKESQKTVITEEGADVYHSLSVATPEFDVFMPNYDQAFLSHCALFWDCEATFEERTRGAGETLHLDNPYLTLLAGIQPAVMNRTFPEPAWGQGFMARCIFAYADKMPKDKLFSSSALSKELEDELVADLKAMHNRTGFIGFTRDAVEEIEAWYESDCAPQPIHPRLVFYNSRRALQTIKIALLYAVARGHGKIELDDFTSAREALILTEEDLTDMLHAIVRSDTSHAELYHGLHQLILRYGVRNAGAACPEAVARRFLMLSTSNPQLVDAFLQNAYKSGIIEQIFVKGEMHYLAKAYTDVV